METLTERQIEVIRLAARGMTNAEIAAEMGIGPESVKTHLAVVFRKLNTANRAGAVHRAQLAGYLDEGDPGDVRT